VGKFSSKWIYLKVFGCFYQILMEIVAALRATNGDL
jgi:hypothetical protein